MIKFNLGQVVATKGALKKFTMDEINICLFRHSIGDWGDMDKEDKKLNDDALKHGGRLFSSYNLPNGKLWVITEADRSYTTILLPEEY